MDEKDFKMVQIAGSIEEVIEILEPDIKGFYQNRLKKTSKLVFFTVPLKTLL